MMVIFLPIIFIFYHRHKYLTYIFCFILHFTEIIQDENKSIDGAEESTSSSAGDDAVFGSGSGATDVNRDINNIKKES